MDEQITTSPSLLLRIRNAKDHEAWLAFQEIYLPLIRSFCVHWGLQETDADDVVQEVLVAVSRSINSFEYQPGRGRFRSWLGTVTANEIKSWLSKAKSRSLNESSALTDLMSRHYSPSSWAVMFSEHIFQTACQRVRANCEPETWQCFQATWLDKKSAAEVATEMSIPVHSVYVNKSRVLQRLEQEVRMLADDLPWDFATSNVASRTGMNQK